MKRLKSWLEELEHYQKAQRGLMGQLPYQEGYFYDHQQTAYVLSNPTREDVHDLVAIQRSAYGGKAPWDASTLRNDIEFNRRSYYIIVKNENQKSVAFIGTWMSAKEVHISNLCVLEDYQGLGIGSFLVQEMKRIGSQLKRQYFTLEVRVSNHGARDLYKRLGFKEVRIKPRYYYDNKEDAVDMKMFLNTEDAGPGHLV